MKTSLLVGGIDEDGKGNEDERVMAQKKMSW
jgi:hypothetical protein